MPKTGPRGPYRRRTRQTAPQRAAIELRVVPLERRIVQLEAVTTQLSNEVTELQGTLNWMRQTATLDKAVLKAARALAAVVLDLERHGSPLYRQAIELMALTDR